MTNLAYNIIFLCLSKIIVFDFYVIVLKKKYLQSLKFLIFFSINMRENGNKESHPYLSCRNLWDSPLSTKRKGIVKKKIDLWIE